MQKLSPIHVASHGMNILHKNKVNKLWLGYSQVLYLVISFLYKGGPAILQMVKLLLPQVSAVDERVHQFVRELLIWYWSTNLLLYILCIPVSNNTEKSGGFEQHSHITFFFKVLLWCPLLLFHNIKSAYLMQEHPMTSQLMKAELAITSM